MKIAIYQSGSGSGPDKEQRLSDLALQAAQARSDGAALLLCPEMFLCGYNIGRSGVVERAETIGGPSQQIIAALARRTGIAIAAGFAERGADGRHYNSAVLFDADGKRRLHHRKLHLYGDLDREMFSPGNHLPLVAEWNGIQVGILICYDAEFPEAARVLALSGCDLLLVPTALMDPFSRVAHILIPARAMENQIFVAYANRCDREGDLTYCGQSVICGPKGDLARADRSEGLIIADLDFQELTQSRLANPYLQDRRADAYGAVLAE
ncbi:MAG: carbon-nitrogen hydrolase family protein [Pseudomonadota bacterium]